MYRVLVAMGIFLFFTVFISGEAYAHEIEGKKVNDSRGILVEHMDFPRLHLADPHMQGEAIWLLQARLKELGYELEPTGVFTYDTALVVELFQLAEDLGATGVVDKEMWQNLMVSGVVEPCITGDTRLLDGRVVIEIETRKLLLTVYQNDNEVAKYPVALGKSSTPTPLGEWRVVHKSLNWGGGFGSRWLGLNVPWGIYGIHGTNKPGSIGTYASAGCIRMFNRDVEKLYPTIPLNATVRILEDGKMFPANIKPILLKAGSSGQQVVYVQSRLKELGYEFDRADGRFGKMTELAIKYFQAWHLLDPTGEVNEATYQALGMIE